MVLEFSSRYSNLIMKSKRFQFKYRKNASKLHKATGDWLRINYSNNKIYQEYSVKYVNSTWSNYRAKYDWVIKDLKIIIEVMSDIHIKEIQWHGRVVANPDIKSRSLKEIQEQDQLKKEAAEAAGYLYVTILPNEKLEDVLPERLALPHPEKTLVLEEKQKSSYDIERKKKAKEYRKEQYLRNKKWRKQLISQRIQNSQDE